MPTYYGIAKAIFNAKLPLSVLASLAACQPEPTAGGGFIELSTMFTPPGTPPAEVIAKSKFVSLGMYPVRYRLKK